MADKQISELTSASALTDGSLFVIEQGGVAKSANWGMMKNYISPEVAAQYSTSATYDVGDYVIYNGNLYRCTTAITTPESWTAAHWTAAVLGDDVEGIKRLMPMPYPNISSFSYPDDFQSTINLSNHYISDRVIKAGSFIKALTAYFSGPSNNVYVFLFNSATNEVIYKKNFSAVAGHNSVSIDYTPAVDCVMGIYGVNFKVRAVYTAYYDYDDTVFSTGYIEASPVNPNVGDTITLTQYSTNQYIIFPVFLSVVEKGDIFGVENFVETTKNQIMDSGTKTEPRTMTGDQYTTSISSGVLMISDRVIPAGSFIKSANVFFKGASPTCYLYIIDYSTNVVLEKIMVTVGYSMWKKIPVNYYADVDCVIGIYGHNLNIATYCSDEKRFSMGVITGTPGNANVGDTITTSIYSNDDVPITAPVQWDYSIASPDGLKSASDNLNYKLFSGISQVTERDCIVSFIDDDTGSLVNDIWGPIISQEQIRMGFACIAGYMFDGITPSYPQYVQMTEQELKALYDAGHDVYSHSYTHPAFYEASLQTIEDECRLSKQALIDHGFTRNADIIVYPGGLDRDYHKNEQRLIISQFYSYGVDAGGGGFNSSRMVDSEPYKILRINGDTSSLATLKSGVDTALAYGGYYVLMFHAYELNKDKVNNVQKVIDLIQYIKGKGNVKILPFSEALRRKNGWRR